MCLFNYRSVNLYITINNIILLSNLVKTVIFKKIYNFKNLGKQYDTDNILIDHRTYTRGMTNFGPIIQS